jgi:iron complex outermembrane receptor protein/outer membrane receptor for ferrienterochelin and colicins
MKKWNWYLVFLLLLCTVVSETVFAEEESADVFTLGEVVVTGEKGTVNMATTVTEVSMEEVAAKGAQTVADALEFLPGVSVQTAGKGQVFVSIRGFDQDQVKVLIDGIPARENYFGTVDLSMLPADSIAKITVTKGASSVLYGSDTLGGVINIVTKKGGSEPRTSFTASFGENATANYFLNHGGSVGNLNYWFSGGYQTSDGFNLSGDFDSDDPNVGLGSSYNEDGGVRDLSDYTKKSLDAKIGYDPGGDSSLYLSFNYAEDERGVPTSASRYWRFIDWTQWHLNLVGEHKFNDVFSMKGKLFYVKHDDGLLDVSWDEDHTTGRKWFEESYYDDSSIGGELQTALTFSEKSILRLCANYMKDDHKGADFYDEETMYVTRFGESVGWTEEQEYVANTYNLALEEEYKATDQISLVLGVSYDAFEPTKTYDQPEPGRMDTVNPQVGMVFDMTDATRFHASVGKKTRFPSLKELYSEHAGGNPDLEPEKTMAYEAGVSHIFSEKVSVEASYFYYDVEDLISTTELDEEDVYVNIDEATISGLEAGIDLTLTDAFKAGVNYTYMDTVDGVNDDRQIENRPRHRVNLDTVYRFAFGLTANIQASYVGDRYWEDYAGEWTKMENYFLFNAKLTQKLKKVGAVESEIFFQGSNILDEDYIETGAPEPGFNFLAGITLRM